MVTCSKVSVFHWWGLVATLIYRYRDKHLGYILEFWSREIKRDPSRGVLERGTIGYKWYNSGYRKLYVRWGSCIGERERGQCRRRGREGEISVRMLEKTTRCVFKRKGKPTPPLFICLIDWREGKQERIYHKGKTTSETQGPIRQKLPGSLTTSKNGAALSA